MAEITTIQMGNKYNDIILLDEYNEQISVVSAREGKDGKIYPQWVFPQDKDRQPRDKAIPLKVTLGDRATAARHLRFLADALEGMESTRGIGGDELPPAKPQQPEDNDDIPF